MSRPSPLGLLLVAPALLLVAALFLYPLGFSLVAAFTANGEPTLAHFEKAFELYATDIRFTVFIVLVSTALIALISIAIAGVLTLSETPWLITTLRWLYRWPLFIPFIVAAQCMRTFLAKNGLMNNTLVAAGILDPIQTASLLDWRGIVITFVWKQVPFVTLMLAGAMASLDRATIEAGRNLGASRLRVLVEIVLPQVGQTLLVGLVLSFVTMLSVLSVPMMVAGSQPTMLTVDMAFRINSYGDYATANALGVISYAMTAVVAWIYLRHQVRHGAPHDPAQSSARRAKALALALFAFALFGPLANLALWSVAERWYTPFKLPVTYGLRYWEVVFRPTGDAMSSLATSVAIAGLTVLVALLVSVPAGYALARLKLPARTLIMIAFLLPQAFPVGRDLHQRRAHLLPDRACRHRRRRRAGPRRARPRLLGLDRRRGLRRRRPRPRARGAQHGRLGLAHLCHHHAAARRARHHGERDLRVPRSRSTSSPAPSSSACRRSRPCRSCSTRPRWAATTRSPRSRR